MSPILGLTQDTDRIAQFPSLGKLRKGAPMDPNKKGPGRELSYFRFTSDLPDVRAAFKKVHGEEPAILTVYLPYPGLDENFATWREEWKAGGLQHRCNGADCTVWLENGAYVLADATHKKDCPYADKAQKECKVIGRLTVIVPELWVAGFVGYVTLGTGSIHDVTSIYDSLSVIADSQSQSGRSVDLRNIPMVLRRVEREVSTPGADGKRARRSHWLVTLEPAAKWVRGLQQITKLSLPMLKSGVEQDVATDQDPDEFEDAEVVEAEVVDEATGEIVEEQIEEQIEEKVEAPHWAKDEAKQKLLLDKGKKLKLSNAAFLHRLGVVEGKAISDLPITFEQAMALLDTEPLATGSAVTQESMPF